MSDLERVLHGTQVSTRYSEQGKRKEAKYLTILNVQFVSKALLKKKKGGVWGWGNGKEKVGMNSWNNILQKSYDGFLLFSSLLLTSDNWQPEELLVSSKTTYPIHGKGVWLTRRSPRSPSSCQLTHPFPGELRGWEGPGRSQRREPRSELRARSPETGLAKPSSVLPNQGVWTAGPSVALFPLNAWEGHVDTLCFWSWQGLKVLVAKLSPGNPISSWNGKGPQSLQPSQGGTQLLPHASSHRRRKQTERTLLWRCFNER